MGLNVNQDQSYNIKTFSNDTVLNYVQKYHISLQDEHIKHNNQHLRKVNHKLNTFCFIALLNL